MLCSWNSPLLNHSGIPKDKSAECFNDNYEDSTPGSTGKWSSILELFKNRYFVILQFAHFLIIMSHHVIPTMLPEHIVLLGGTMQQGADTVVIIGAANTISRFLQGNTITDSPKLLMVTLAVSSLVSGASLLLSILFKDYWMYVCLSIIFGLTRGIYVTCKVSKGHTLRYHSHNTF